MRLFQVPVHKRQAAQTADHSATRGNETAVYRIDNRYSRLSPTFADARSSVFPAPAKEKNLNFGLPGSSQRKESKHSLHKFQPTSNSIQWTDDSVIKKKTRWHRGSNTGQADLQSATLPLSYTTHVGLITFIMNTRRQRKNYNCNHHRLHHHHHHIISPSPTISIAFAIILLDLRLINWFSHLDNIKRE